MITSRRFFEMIALTILVLGVGFSGLTATAEAHQTPWGQGESQPQDLVISLATFSPGDEIPQWFGHTGVIVEDRRRNISRLYNYGMFSFDSQMLIRFAMGRLWFWVAPTDVGRTFNLYVSEDRDVRVLELNIPEEKRVEVAAFLSDNVRPENREYLYHHYYDNCSTRIRDIIDIAVDGQFAEALEHKPGRWTLREHTRRHSGHLAPMDWLLMYLMNNEIDPPSTVWEEMFLPEELERQVLDFDWVDEDGEVHPLVLREHLVYEAEEREPVPAAPPTHWPWYLLFGAIIGGVGLFIGWSARTRPGRGSRIRYGLYHGFVGLLLGFPGLVLGAMSTFTEHTVTYWNQNLFWANPATLAVLVLAVMVMRGKQKSRRSLVLLWSALALIAVIGVVVNIVGIFVPSFYQDTSLAMASMLPIVLGAVASAWLVDGDKVVAAATSDSEAGEP